MSVSTSIWPWALSRWSQYLQCERQVQLDSPLEYILPVSTLKSSFSTEIVCRIIREASKCLSSLPMRVSSFQLLQCQPKSQPSISAFTFQAKQSLSWQRYFWSRESHRRGEAREKRRASTSIFIIVYLIIIEPMHNNRHHFRPNMPHLPLEGVQLLRPQEIDKLLKEFQNKDLPPRLTNGRFLPLKNYNFKVNEFKIKQFYQQKEEEQKIKEKKKLEAEERKLRISQKKESNRQLQMSKGCFDKTLHANDRKIEQLKNKIKKEGPIEDWAMKHSELSVIHKDSDNKQQDFEVESVLSEEQECEQAIIETGKTKQELQQQIEKQQMMMREGKQNDDSFEDTTMDSQVFQSSAASAMAQMFVAMK